MGPSQTSYSCQRDICPCNICPGDKFSSPIFLDKDILCNQNSFRSKDFYDQNLFFTIKIFSLDKKCFWAKMIFGFQIFVGLEIVWNSNFLDLKLFLDPTFFWTHISLNWNFFGPRFFFTLNFFRPQNLF